MQLKLCAQVRVGLDWRDFHQASYRAISEFLREIGVINVSADEAIDTALTSVFYPHGIGHLLGLQVHDVGGRQRDPAGGEIERPYNHPFLRLTRKLEDGFVVTVEPGFYFIDQLLNEAKQKADRQNDRVAAGRAAEEVRRRAHRGRRGRASGRARESHAAGVRGACRAERSGRRLDQHPRRECRVQRAQQRQQTAQARITGPRMTGAAKARKSR